MAINRNLEYTFDVELLGTRLKNTPGLSHKDINVESQININGKMCHTI